MRLLPTSDFQTFLKWFDAIHVLCTQNAIHGHDEKFTPDVLRGRAQILGVIKAELEKAPDVAGKIQRVS
jgi:hypothetical protein